MTMRTIDLGINKELFDEIYDLIVATMTAFGMKFHSQSRTSSRFCGWLTCGTTEGITLG